MRSVFALALSLAVAPLAVSALPTAQEYQIDPSYLSMNGYDAPSNDAYMPAPGTTYDVPYGMPYEIPPPAPPKYDTTAMKESYTMTAASKSAQATFASDHVAKSLVDETQETDAADVSQPPTTTNENEPTSTMEESVLTQTADNPQATIMPESQDHAVSDEREGAKPAVTADVGAPQDPLDAATKDNSKNVLDGMIEERTNSNVENDEVPFKTEPATKKPQERYMSTAIFRGIKPYLNSHELVDSITNSFALPVKEGVSFLKNHVADALVPDNRVPDIAWMDLNALLMSNVRTVASETVYACAPPSMSEDGEETPMVGDQHIRCIVDNAVHMQFADRMRDIMKHSAEQWIIGTQIDAGVGTKFAAATKSDKSEQKDGADASDSAAILARKLQLLRVLASHLGSDKGVAKFSLPITIQPKMITVNANNLAKLVTDIVLSTMRVPSRVLAAIFATAYF